MKVVRVSMNISSFKFYWSTVIKKGDICHALHKIIVIKYKARMPGEYAKSEVIGGTVTNTKVLKVH